MPEPSAHRLSSLCPLGKTWPRVMPCAYYVRNTKYDGDHVPEMQPVQGKTGSCQQKKVLECQEMKLGTRDVTHPRDYGLPALAHQPGVCRYGTKMACCYGWKRNSKGICEATCEPRCKFGECVGPNKCRCFPGYTGKTCSQDVNECGAKPRPCQHRCVNTHGSYKCFCLSGHMLLPDATCSNSRTCARANCQYSCEETEEGPRCVCPSSGLRLGPNGRVCLDIDECASRKAVCPYNRRCVNTFGSYYCKCHIGFELKYVSRRYDCI
ncbi:epidermal growth factor-like protein 6, partial [Cricetulus griseus]|uniref:epidermal growth factor-like protein 6 n=1 Tax=Cricetulus griseus TaxID=10029 RepID=UPI0004547D3D